MKKSMKMAAGGVLGAVVVGVLALAALKPSEYRIERSIEISGSADAVYARLVELAEWEKWSPWRARDPKMKMTYEGPKSGVGATQSWTGSDGDGTLKITDSVMNQKMRYQLTFKSWDAKSDGEFRLEPVSAASTRLVWVMEGKNGFIGKLFWMLFGVDKSVTADFDQGLLNIKNVVEQTRAAAIAAAEAAQAAQAAATAAAQAAKLEAQAQAQASAKAQADAEAVEAQQPVTPTQQ